MRRLPLALALCLLLVPRIGSAAEAEFRSLTQWRAYNGVGIPASWIVSGGDIRHTPGGGDLVSVETFRNFELAFEWRVPRGGNSGIMYLVIETPGAPYESGPEYQILDNLGHPDGATPLTAAGSVYGLYPPFPDVAAPAGHWNSGRILVHSGHVEHWLNGTRVLDYELGSADWEKRVADSKFAAWPEFGTAVEGHVSLQDHDTAVDYRNVRVRTLPD